MIILLVFYFQIKREIESWQICFCNVKFNFWVLWWAGLSVGFADLWRENGGFKLIYFFCSIELLRKVKRPFCFVPFSTPRQPSAGESPAPESILKQWGWNY